MANGSMTTNITEERATRVALIEEGFVDCIVQLPARGGAIGRVDASREDSRGLGQNCVSIL
jgi:hypothetical protein